MILLAFLIGTAAANPHPCTSALWISREEHRQCIIAEWNKMHDPLGLRQTPRFTRVVTWMDYSDRPIHIMTPWHTRLWLESAHRKADPGALIKFGKIELSLVGGMTISLSP